MRVTSISLLSDDSKIAQFDLRHEVTRSKFIVKSIFGMDTEEIIPRFYGFSKDGTKRYYDFKLPKREIVIRIVLNPKYKLNESNSDLRDQIYKAISATRTGEIEILFHSGASTISKLVGHIIKLEAPHSSNIPEIQITIKCNDPMYRGIAPTIMLADDIPDTNPVSIPDSASTAPHGFKMQITLTASLANLTIQDKASSPEWDFKVIPTTTFLSGDVIYFSSEFNNRYLYMVRSAVTTHLLDRIVPESVWPIIFPGNNEFHFVNIASFDWNNIQFDTAFWGV